MWREQIEHLYETDSNGLKADIPIISGRFKHTYSISRPSHLYAAIFI